MKYHAKNLTNAPTVYHTQRGLFLHSRSSFYFRHKLYTSTISRIPTFRPSCFGFSFFRPPPDFLTLYVLFSPIIIRAAPAAIRPGHGRKSSSFRYNHPLESVHIQFFVIKFLTSSINSSSFTDALGHKKSPACFDISKSKSKYKILNLKFPR